MRTRRSSRTNRTAHKERKDSRGTKKAPKLGRDNESEGEEEASGRNRNLYLKTNQRKERAANKLVFVSTFNMHFRLSF